MGLLFNPWTGFIFKIVGVVMLGGARFVVGLILLLGGINSLDTQPSLWYSLGWCLLGLALLAWSIMVIQNDDLEK